MNRSDNDDVVVQDIGTDNTGNILNSLIASMSNSSGTSVSGNASAGGGDVASGTTSSSMQTVTTDNLEGLWINNFIKSRNYKPKSQGFLVDGLNGYIECMKLFVGNGGIIGGSLDIPNTTSANSFHVDNQGNIWSGSTTFSNAPFSVTNAGVLSATSGTIGGWEIQPTLLKSAASGARIELNQAKDRISIFDSANEKVVMGYLANLPKHDGSGNWSSSNYGFWALTGDRLSIDGAGEFTSGDWIVQNDASYLINDGLGNTIVKLGTDTGEKGLFVYNTLGAQLAKYTSDSIFVGEATKYLSYDAVNGLKVKGNHAEIDVGNTGYIYGGQSSYNSGIGFWMGYDGGTPKLSIGDPANDHLYWDGSHLTIQGTASLVGTLPWSSITDDGGKPPTSLFVTPSGNGLFLSPTHFGFYNDTYTGDEWRTYMDSSGNFYLGGTISPKLSFNGTTLAVKGAITASTIDIGSGSSSFHVDVSGNIWSGAATYNQSTNPFAVSAAGALRAMSATIAGTSTVGGTLATTIGGAINSSGQFINDVVNSDLSTFSNQILGSFTFGSSGAIAIATNSSNGVWISPTGILGKSDGNNTFAITSSGNATFYGTLSGASGTFGTITAGNISGVSISGSTITGSTLQTAASGWNVNITTDTIQLRSGASVMGWWEGNYPIAGQATLYTYDLTCQYLDVNQIRGYSDPNNIYCRNLLPSSGNGYTLGSSSYYWSSVYCGAMSVSGSINPTSNLSYTVGTSSYSWAQMYCYDIYKSNHAGWGFSSFDEGVELQDGTIVSDVEAFLRLEPDTDRPRSKLGTYVIKTSTLPKAVHVPAKDETENDTEDVFGMMSIMIGAIKELGIRLKDLEDKINN